MLYATLPRSGRLGWYLMVACVACRALWLPSNLQSQLMGPALEAALFADWLPCGSPPRTRYLIARLVTARRRCGCRGPPGTRNQAWHPSDQHHPASQPRAGTGSRPDRHGLDCPAQLHVVRALSFPGAKAAAANSGVGSSSRTPASTRSSSTASTIHNRLPASMLLHLATSLLLPGSPSYSRH